MVRTKVEINVTALQKQIKSMSIIIGSNTTASDVIRKILDKFHIREPPEKYQLLAFAKDSTSSQAGQVLDSHDHLGSTLRKSKIPLQITIQPLVLHSSTTSESPPNPAGLSHPQQTSDLIRVYHQLGQGVQSFQSLIVTPNMTGKQMLVLMVSRAAPSGRPEDFSLVLVTPNGESEVHEGQYPYSMRQKSSHFELRKKNKKKEETAPLSAYSPSPSLSAPPPELGRQDLMHTQHLLKGKLRIRGELIDALQELAAQLSQQEKGRELDSIPPDNKSRETVLEQALVEQSEILDVMQELISTLESENKQSREKLANQFDIVVGWEERGRALEEELAEAKKKLSSHHRVTSRESNLEKKLEEKDRLIMDLQSKLRSTSESGVSSLLTELASTRAKLEMERVSCIELKEELFLTKGKITELKRMAADYDSTRLAKESEILHLKHELQMLRSYEQQQQDLIMKQRSSLADKNLQLSSLTRALQKEKMVADQLRRIQHSSTSFYSLTGDSSSSESMESLFMQASLFDQVLGRQMHTIELTRITKDSELGFSFVKGDLPVSSRVPSLIVKNVKADSMAAGLLKPGDELLEVNGIPCCSIRQSSTIKLLEQGEGVLKMVVAREGGIPAVRQSSFSHSTPMKRAIDESSPASFHSAHLWTTALSSPDATKNATFESFSASLQDPAAENKSPEFVMIPESYSVKEKAGNLDSCDDRDNLIQPSAAGEDSEKSSIAGSESLILSTSSKEDAAVRRKLQSEIAELRMQLDESEQIRLDIEAELNATRDDSNHLQEEHDLALAENHDLRDQVATYGAELEEIKESIPELQTALLSLEEQLRDEQQKSSSMANQNRVISSELLRAKDVAAQATGVKADLEDTILQLKSKLEESKRKETAAKEEAHELRAESSRLSSSLTNTESQVEELRASLEKSRQELETTASLKLECAQLQSQLESEKELVKNSALSSQEEYQHLVTQLKSAKGILAEYEMKESQLQVEMRYLKQAADLANTQLEKSEENQHKLREELGHLKQQMEEKTLELESLNLAFRDKQRKLEAKQEIITRLQGDVDGLRRSNSRQRSQISQLRDCVNSLELSFSEAQAEAERLEAKLEASEREKDELFQHLEKSFEESTSLSATVEVLSTQVQELEGAQLKNSSSPKITAKERAENEDLQLLKASEARLQRDLETSQKKIEMLSQQHSRTKDEMTQLESRHRESIKELQESQVKGEQLAAAKEEMSQQVAELESEMGNYRQEIMGKDQELNDTRSTLSQLQEEVEIEKKHSSSYKTQIEALESEVSRLRGDKEQRENMVASLEFIQKQDQDKLEEIRSRVEGKEREIVRLNGQVDELNQLLQKSKSEQTSQSVSEANLRELLEETRKNHSCELKDLKTLLLSKENQYTSLSDEFKALEAKNEMTLSQVQLLTESLEQFSTEKDSLELCLEETKKKKVDLQAQSREQQSQIASLKSALEEMTSSSDTLSSESASLRQKVRQRERESDQLSAELHATQMNFSATKQALEESENASAIKSEKLEILEAQHKQVQSKLQNVGEELDKKSMEVFVMDEELSKLKATFDLQKKEIRQLQESLLVMEASAGDSERRAQRLETEKEELTLNVDELHKKIETLELSLKKLEEEKESMESDHMAESSGLEKEIKELKAESEEKTNKIVQLSAAQEKAKDSIAQLMSAQEDMKKSISKIGSEKDMEIIQLQEAVRESKFELEEASEALRSALKKEELTKGRVVLLEQELMELKKELEVKASEVRQQLEAHEATEVQTAELNGRLRSLDENLRGKAEKLTEFEELNHLLNTRVKDLESENEALLEKVGEISTMKLSLAEKSEESNELKKRLTAMERDYKQAVVEKDKYLSKIRELEVSQHTSPSKDKKPAKPEAKDKKQLMVLLQQKEEEVLRTREYAENLLAVVIDKAPHLLEK